MQRRLEKPGKDRPEITAHSACSDGLTFCPSGNVSGYV